ncbi:MAG TPA: hypothetical protein VN837_20115, partial [Chloroflexota bacterium]|nr:hypothetical protein [Chloroflexota bacterium]
MAGDLIADPPRIRASALLAVGRNRGFLSSLVFFLLMLAAFAIFSPGVFLHSAVYTAVFVSLPIFLMLTVGLVFVVVAGEIDLAFPSTVGMCAYVFSGCVSNGWSPFLGLLLAVICGLIIGSINGILVTYVK